jgi:hypothetical protein
VKNGITAIYNTSFSLSLLKHWYGIYMRGLACAGALGISNICTPLGHAYSYGFEEHMTPIFLQTFREIRKNYN